MSERDAPDPLHPPVPPISARDAPRFGTDERKQTLAAAFQGQGADYDRLRPGYPDAVLDEMLAHSPRRAVDLGAGTGKLSGALAERGLQVTAVDTSAAMLEIAASGGPLITRVAAAESTGLPARSAELVTVAQAWHWFDDAAASTEVARLLTDDGLLALVWNMLDVTIPWVHRLSRIMHAGDIHREDFLPVVGPELELVRRGVHDWEDPMPTGDVIDLARTRSYVITAPEERRATVLANLDWYLHEHLGHAPGEVIGVPYRTDWFLYRPTGA
ncbi:SAM-dependent methyltransferase [Brachybacterium ginsengisoli]|uniref:SAM-dependent methyltransferase n=1 Tax=Brachybacterium ginsengisoli TaxID=1331682 RepID=A0A291GUF6_9MICO|nr:class I SAM-dependent methyltransferase [Brachybacterium ginsengisoli]ATG53839.1 SAM-dependent methyltransferase [Brachybacterium ginsengisoli]